MTNNISPYVNNQPDHYEFSLIYLAEKELHCICSLLPVRDLIHVGETCKMLQTISNTPEFWTAFYRRITFNQGRASAKEFVITEIQRLLNISRGNNPQQAMGAHLSLTRIGMSSCRQALDTAKMIPVTDEEKAAHPTSPFHCKTFYDKCHSIAFAYLEENQLSNVRKMIRKMVPSTTRGIIALKLEKKYLEMGDFRRAFSAMRYIKIDQLESDPALSWFIWSAKQANEMDWALKALKKFSDFKIAPSCIKDIYEYLMEIEESEKAQQLQLAYPNAFGEYATISDAKYFTYNQQIEKAIQVAQSLQFKFHRIEALEAVAKIGEKSGSMQFKQEQLPLIKDLIKVLYKSLP